MSIRTEKVASVIKRELAGPVTDLANELSAGLVTITSVRLSKDLHIAKVYISIYGGSMSQGEFLSVLDDNSKSLRGAIGRNLHLRYIPELRFYLDDTLDQMEHIQDILDSVKSQKKDSQNSDNDTR